MQRAPKLFDGSFAKHGDANVGDTAILRDKVVPARVLEDVIAVDAIDFDISARNRQKHTLR